MFRGLRQLGAAAAIVVGAAVSGGALTATAAMADDTGEAGADFLTVTSSPAGGFENLAPGGTAVWFVTARNSAAVDAALSLRVQSDSDSALLTDAAQGLRMRLTACSMAWTGTTGAFQCPGVETRVADGALAVILGGYPLPAVPAGSAAHYLAEVSVPREATNDVAGQTADLRFEITAVQGEPQANASATRVSGGAAATEPGSGPAVLAGTGISGASACRSLALALLGAGSLVLVLRRIGIE
ncbi:hypothetical protein [Cryobacterium tepidiphilum]|uniref:Gram-positive cocci surface proteins LPxTG domain-containing protein n=1 Tax=Cryobacterium tepidiphilum TaxID=2486026 RepID=A0A3M8KTI4_9MICO|nr:hypothetical protein [Cryobacterium tepidiphilum]RNE56631.1 hypothetical protein EEJ31_13210 [Cryobacterium tepidiphilum]